jgi:dihydroorotate dehydrogenase
MNPAIASALLPVIHRLDPETAHGVAIWALRAGLVGSSAAPDDPALAVQALGCRFANPIGLAAGFDKDAVAVEPLMRLGFGFVEAGTVTPLPQSGNPRPRLFRLDVDRAAINRMGFNNRGLEAFRARVAGRKRGRVVFGCNVGINKSGADPERDYPALVEALAPYADYMVINVSSPNTPGLRDLQGEAQLHGILTAVARRVPRRPPLLVKIAPDLSSASLEGLIETCLACEVQGLIVSNTTISRPPDLRSATATEAGGLSGAPVFALSTSVLARAYLQARDRLTLIGAGGVATGADALAKLRAGASLVQLYTALVFAGPALIPRLKRELVAALRQAGFADVRQAVGVDADHFARGP